MNNMEAILNSQQQIKTALIQRYKTEYACYLSDKTCGNKELKHIESYLTCFCSFSESQINAMKAAIIVDFKKAKEEEKQKEKAWRKAKLMDK